RDAAATGVRRASSWWHRTGGRRCCSPWRGPRSAAAPRPGRWLPPPGRPGRTRSRRAEEPPGRRYGAAGLLRSVGRLHQVVLGDRAHVDGAVLGDQGVDQAGAEHRAGAEVALDPVAEGAEEAVEVAAGAAGGQARAAGVEGGDGVPPLAEDLHAVEALAQVLLGLRGLPGPAGVLARVPLRLLQCPLLGHLRALGRGEVEGRRGGPGEADLGEAD